ncbi:ATP-dependent helicase [Nocardiopsis gilva YIM 90087]|uniref:ATP-dependent helicase n=2 Tax=Nocardiopsis gilva TaxID=280236 RepID=A0A223S7P4_9ACTN|nr:ATP-dependent helicase [Nocardiopsis gilva YIM 90087]
MEIKGETEVLVLHGLWESAAGDGTADGAGSLVLWGEDATLPARTVSRATIRPHPYAAAEARLRAAITSLTGAPDARAASAAEVDLLLPGSPTHPLPSPALGPVASAPTVSAPRLRRWRIAGVRIPPATAARMLTGLMRASKAHTGSPTAQSMGDLALGPGLHHLIAVHEFAARLASEGRVLPRIIGDPPRARWRPVLSGPGTRHLTALIGALPPVARAHLDPEGTGAGELVLAALHDLLDATARDRLGSLGPGQRRGRSALTTALTNQDGAYQPAAETAALAAQLRDWHHAAQRPRGRARLLFRLIEPERNDSEEAAAPKSGASQDDSDAGTGAVSGRPAPGGEVWRVEFWVQSDADPSLQLSLADLWLGEGSTWLPDDVESTVLRDLSRAARHYPAVHSALRELAPSAITMGTGGAYAFIRDVAPRLSAAGFAVVLPEWTGRGALGLRLTAREQQPSPGRGGISPTDLVDFSFDAVLGDETVDLEELAQLARLKQPLIRLRGRWVEVDPAHLRTALDFLRRRGNGTMRRDEALRAAMAPDAAPLPVTDVDADGALGALLSGATEQRLTPMSTPADFDGSLRPYQQRGAAWLRFLGSLGLGAILADDMGLGKTVQLLALLTQERAEETTSETPAPGPTLLICPVSLVGNWQREAARFAPDLRVHIHHDPSRPHGNALARIVGVSDLIVTTYGVVLRDADELAAMPWHRVVCDEAQAIKNSGTRQARAVRGLNADCRIALTGTPVENNLGELWSIMEFANPGLLGSEAAFRQGIAGRVEREASEAGSVGGGESTALLKRMTGPFILRRLKTDRSIISDLPEKHEMRTWCTLTPEQASLYKAAVDDMTERIDGADGIQRKGLVLATMARLKQICNHPAQFLGDGSELAGRSGKLERLAGLLSEALAEGDKALCFTQYTALGDRWSPYLAARLGREVLWLHGGTPRARREEMMERFQTSTEPMVFLLSLKAAGTGLNLTAANQVVHIDRWWNPAVEDQATDRAFRIGQRRDVQVRKLVCVGTLEERVDEMIERKKALAQGVIATGEDWLTELSTEQLREVIRLAPEAVAR